MILKHIFSVYFHLYIYRSIHITIYIVLHIQAVGNCRAELGEPIQVVAKGMRIYAWMPQMCELGEATQGRN